MLGWLNALKCTETRDEPSTTLYLQSEIFQDACQRLMLHPYLHRCLKNKQLKLNAFGGKDPTKGVFSIMHSYFETFG